MKNNNKNNLKNVVNLIAASKKKKSKSGKSETKKSALIKKKSTLLEKERESKLLLKELKNEKKKLKESEERFSKAFNSNPAAMIISDIETGLFIDINEKCAELLEYSKKETIGRTSYDLEIWADKNVRKRALRKLKKYGRFKDVPVTFIKRSGEKIDCLWSAEKIDIDEREAMLSIMYDNTERKRAEEALINSENQFRRIWEESFDGMRLCDENGIIILVNEAFCRIVEKTKEKLLGNPFSVIYSEGKKDDNLRHFKYRFRNNLFERYFQKREVLHNHKEVWFEVSNSMIELQGRSYMLSIFRDITARKKNEQEIIKLSKGVEQSPAVIIITDINGNIEYVNPKFTQITGYELDEVKGKHTRLLKSDEKNKEEYANLWKTILEGSEWKGEFKNRKKNGEFYWESASIYPIKNEKNEILCFMAIKEEITERKRMIEELIRAKEEAEKFNKLKSEFLAQMSHEIRSPLNVILSYASLIKYEIENNELKLSDELLSSFGSIDSASKRIIRTIDSILNMSELNLGSYEANFKDFDVSKLLHLLIKEYNNAARNKKLSINYFSKVENTTIKSDEYAANQIFANLIDNAIKYTNEGSVDIIVYKNDGYLIIDISDTGIGISKEYIPYVFSEFSQEESGYNRQYEGNGLGLSLVKKYCDIVGAEIHVKSEKTKGSTFSVRFKNNYVE